MEKLYYKVFSHMYLFVRKLKQRQFNNNVFDFYIQKKDVVDLKNNKSILINGEKYEQLDTKNLLYGENLANISISGDDWENNLNIYQSDIDSIWWEFIIQSKVPEGFLNSGLYQTAYCLEKKLPVLSSWIWTSAAISRVYFEYNKFNEVVQIADRFLNLQTDEGGWIVRNDQDFEKVLPAYAPNDSAYIARHSLLNAYIATSDKKYLKAAESCAEWIMENVLINNMVPTNLLKQEQNIIVDVGFTMSLFSELYKITKKTEYFDFIEKFSECFIKLFFDYKENLFSTSVDKNEKKVGGFFSRGQAWALEGLIDTYKVSKNRNIYKIIESNISEIINRQNTDGSWHYNFTRKYLGKDNKGIAVIANAMMDWYTIADENTKIKIYDSSSKAFSWCVNNTVKAGEYKGGIFEFCFEGAITKFFCTETAFLYSNAYALMLARKLN